MTEFASIYQWWSGGRYELRNDTDFSWLNKAISHFEFGQVSENEKINGFINRQRREYFADKLELMFSKIAYLKLYKNGKTEIGFTNSKYALEFANTYLFNEN